MIVPIGDWAARPVGAAGPVGAAVALLAFFGPTAVLTFMVGR